MCKKNQTTHTLGLHYQSGSLRRTNRTRTIETCKSYKFPDALCLPLPVLLNRDRDVAKPHLLPPLCRTNARLNPIIYVVSGRNCTTFAMGTCDKYNICVHIYMYLSAGDTVTFYLYSRESGAFITIIVIVCIGTLTQRYYSAVPARLRVRDDRAPL